jgi:hypothetical protein
MTEGFALIAWPAQFGVSGIVTFAVNQDGIVFQKDLAAAAPRGRIVVRRDSAQGPECRRCGSGTLGAR